jgi:hypothetical protein
MIMNMKELPLHPIFKKNYVLQMEKNSLYTFTRWVNILKTYMYLTIGYIKTYIKTQDWSKRNFKLPK